jgi:hypothetical protein
VTIDGQPGGGEVRFNGCDLGFGGCMTVQMAQATAAKTISAEAITAMTPDSPSETAEAEDEAEASAEAGGDTGPGAQPPLISFAPPATDTVTEDPVTLGAGSDELWRTRKPKKKAPN